MSNRRSTQSSLGMPSMALPARLALWLGVGVMLWGYFTTQWGLLVIGFVVMAVGIVLWLMHRPINKSKNKLSSKDQARASLEAGIEKGKKALGALKKARSNLKP